MEEMLRARYVRKDDGASTPSRGVPLSQPLHIFTNLETRVKICGPSNNILS